MTQDKPQKFGAIALIGATNAGKSTLVNAMVGEKVAITSHKVQTTRFQIRGIALHENAQMVLVDTPGFFKPRRAFDRAMVATAWQSIEDVEVVAFLVDVSKPIDTQKQMEYMDRIKSMTKTEDRILILNKVDTAPRTRLLQAAQELNALCPFDQTFMVSALTGSGVADVVQYCASRMPEGPWVYDADDVTTLPNLIFAAEITREKIYERLHRELPYHIAVETEKFEPSDNGQGYAISQIIILENEKHKPILLGKGGQTLKTIGSLARQDMMEAFQCPVHLNLFVQHRERWLDKDEAHSVFSL